MFCSESMWTDPRFWDGDFRDPAQKIPLELTCNDALMGVAGLENVIQLRGGINRALIDNELQTFRFYLEYAMHGDLDHLIETHRNRGVYIPEPMVWYVAEALARCGLAMQQGSLTAPIAEWDQIVHR